jgi:hypothetical protein
LHGDVGRVFDAGLEPFHVDAQFLGGAASFADILNMSHEETRLSLRVANRGHIGQAPNDLSVAAEVAFLDGDSVVRLANEGRNAFVGPLAILGMSQVDDIAADEF